MQLFRNHCGEGRIQVSFCHIVNTLNDIKNDINTISGIDFLVLFYNEYIVYTSSKLFAFKEMNTTRIPYRFYLSKHIKCNGTLSRLVTRERGVDGVDID